jgi:hypothetical protein
MSRVFPATMLLPSLPRVSLLLATLALVSCASTTTPDAKVWSSSSSSDGFAGCPSNTTVVGGGFEMTEALQSPGKVPHVVVSQPYGNGWRVVCADNQGVLVSGCKAWAVCATVLR